MEIAKEVYDFIKEYHINVVYRRFFKDQPSEYYDEIRKEGVGGPAYKYRDEFCYARTTRVLSPTTTRGTDRYNIEGLVNEDYYAFYFPYGNFDYALHSPPKNGDEIYIVSDFTNASNEINNGVAERYRIVRVIPNYEYNTVSYYLVIAIKEERKY